MLIKFSVLLRGVMSKMHTCDILFSLMCPANIRSKNEDRTLLCKISNLPLLLTLWRFNLLFFLSHFSLSTYYYWQNLSLYVRNKEMTTGPELVSNLLDFHLSLIQSYKLGTISRMVLVIRHLRTVEIVIEIMRKPN